MGVARMVGHITYLSAPSMKDKFGRRLQRGDDIHYELTVPEYEVESYLHHQAEKFVKRFDPNTYLYTSRALSYFDLAREHGDGSLETALQNIEANTLLICFSSDWLYPPGELASRSRMRSKRTASRSSSTSSRRHTGTIRSCSRKRVKSR